MNKKDLALTKSRKILQKTSILPYFLSFTSIIFSFLLLLIVIKSQTISLISENTQNKIVEPLLKPLDLIYFHLYFFPNKLEKYELFYNEQDFARIARGLPQTLSEELERELTTRPQINGIFVADGKKYDVGISIRGEALANYVNKKKTLGIKFKNEPFLGRDSWNFVVPEQRRYNSVGASEFLARKLGVPVQQWGYISLRINNENMGVYEMVDQTDTSFLELNKLSPDDLVFRESRRQSVVSGNPLDSSFSPHGSWEIDNKPENPHQLDFSPIETLKEINKLEGLQFQNKIIEIVDMEQFLKWSAILYLLNDQHQSDYNNLRLIFLKEKGQFWFIPNHIFVQPITQAVDKIHRNSLNEKIISSPLNFWQRNAVIRQLIFDESFESELLKYLNDKINLINAPIYQDHTKAFRYLAFKRLVNKQNEIIVSNIKTIKSYFAPYEISTYSLATEPNINNIIATTKVNASIFFQPTVDKIILYFEEIPESLPIRVYFDLNNNQKIDSQDKLIIQQRSVANSRAQEMKIDQPLIATTFNTSPYDSPRPIATSNILIESGIGQKLTDVKVIFSNPTSGDKLYSSDYFSSPISKTSQLPAFTENTGPSAYLIRSGRYVVTEDLYIPEGELTIEPGTTIEIGPEVSIISNSNLISRGTQQNPIIFTKSNNDIPWGSLIILNAKEKSEFEYTRIEYGSSHSRNGIFTTGSLTVHFSNLIFQNSSIINSSGDDGLNVKHGNAVVRNSFFYQNAVDHIDFDTVGGEVSNNSFNNEGITNKNSDALDISFSKVSIKNNIFYKNADKCISVGEYSDANIFENIIEGCNYGIAIKDGAKANISANSIKNNNIGIGTYLKKKLYGIGGIATVSSNSFEKNLENTKQEENSTIMAQ